MLAQTFAQVRSTDHLSEEGQGTGEEGPRAGHGAETRARGYCGYSIRSG